jgi:hypothetical protein
VTILATAHTLKNDKGKHKKGKLEFEVSYLICVSYTGSRCVALFIGPASLMGMRPHPLLVVACFICCHVAPVELSLLTCGTGIPLVVNKALHGANGDRVENAPPATHYLDHGPRTAALVSSQWYKW